MAQQPSEHTFSRGTLLRGGAALAAGAVVMGVVGTPDAVAGEAAPAAALPLGGSRLNPNPGFHRARAT